jgi:threonine/homoserine/homoserine lactone efflux protein
MIMPGANTILLFMLSALALNLSPGPSILFILSRCMAEGRRAGLVAVFGLASAAVVQALAAAFGLAALFLYSSLAFAIVKYCGAAYLVYLGVSGLLAGGISGIAASVRRKANVSLARVYRQALTVELLNPKLLLFFFAFLPQFVDPALGPPRAQMLFLGLLFQLTALPTNLAVAFAGGSLARLLARSPRWAPVQSWLSSAVLIGLGLRLALAERR